MKRIILISILMILVSALAVNAAGDKLKITEIEAEVDGDENTVSLSNPSFDIEPESELDLKVTIENQFTSVEDLEIENAVVTVTLENIDDGSDIELKSSKVDLDAGDDKTFSFDFDIPLKLDDDDYDLIIEVEGEDENDTEHKDKIKVSVDVDRTKHDVRFFKKDLTIETLTCDRDTTLMLGIMNVGEEEEDVDIVIRNDRLQILFEDKARLDERPSSDDNTFEKDYEIDLGPAIQGTYTFELRAKYGSKTTKEEVPIYVQQCTERISNSSSNDEDETDDSSTDTYNESSDESSSENQDTTDSSSENIDAQTTTDQQGTSTETETQHTDSTNPITTNSYRSSSLGSTAIIVLEIIVIIVGILLIIMMNRKK